MRFKNDNLHVLCIAWKGTDCLLINESALFNYVNG